MKRKKKSNTEERQKRRKRKAVENKEGERKERKSRKAQAQQKVVIKTEKKMTPLPALFTCTNLLHLPSPALNLC